jgi:hypothetical protein
MLQARLRADEGICSDGEGVWSWPPDAGVKLCGTFRRATEAIKARSPGERVISRNAIARGMPVVPAEPVVTAACFFCCRRAMGAACTRHSPRPLLFEGDA